MAMSNEKATIVGTTIPVSFLFSLKAIVYRLRRGCGWRWKCGQTEDIPPQGSSQDDWQVGGQTPGVKGAISSPLGKSLPETGSTQKKVSKAGES